MRRVKILILSTILVLTLAVANVSILFISNKFLNTPVEPATSLDIPGNEPPYTFDYSWTNDYPYIAHAFGGILGQTYTNSLEAFLLNYQLGHRIFEVDFNLTEDGYVVLAHDAEHWRSSATVQTTGDVQPLVFDITPFTYDNFMSSLWYDQYHPLDLTDLFGLMQKYPDIYIVTDTKYFDEELVKQQFQAIVTNANTIDPTLLDRLIIQIYNPEMLDWIMEIYPWKSVIYTLYAVWNTWTPENVLAFAEASGVKFITMPGSWVSQTVSDLWLPAGITIAAHTINNLPSVARLQSLGVNHFYTDFLLP